jgi:hypothetical protein
MGAVRVGWWGCYLVSFPWPYGSRRHLLLRVTWQVVKYALCTILSQPSPRVALAIGYWLTTGGIAWSAAALVPGFINMYKNDIERNKSHCTVLLGSLLLMGVSLAGFSVLVVTPLQLSGVVGGFLRG